MSSLALDAEALYGELARGVRALLGADTQLAGVVSGLQRISLSYTQGCPPARLASALRLAV